MELIAFAGKDKENWGQLTALINKMDDCDKVIIVKDVNTKGFPAGGKCEMVDVDTSRSLIELKEEILQKTREKISCEFEVALSLASGSGKEHMALLSALLCIPVGVRLVVYAKEGVRFIS